MFSSQKHECCHFSENILINFQRLKTKQKMLQLTAWIQFPGNSAGKGNKQNPSLPELQRLSLELRDPGSQSLHGSVLDRRELHRHKVPEELQRGPHKFLTMY